MHWRIYKCIDDGRQLWGAGDKEGCANLYLECAEQVLSEIGPDAAGAEILKIGIGKAKAKTKPRAAVVLRKAFDEFLKAVSEGLAAAAED